MARVGSALYSVAWLFARREPDIFNPGSCIKAIGARDGWRFRWWAFFENASDWFYARAR